MVSIWWYSRTYIHQIMVTIYPPLVHQTTTKERGMTKLTNWTKKGLYVPDAEVWERVESEAEARGLSPSRLLLEPFTEGRLDSWGVLFETIDKNHREVCEKLDGILNKIQGGSVKPETRRADSVKTRKIKRVKEQGIRESNGSIFDKLEDLAEKKGKEYFNPQPKSGVK